MNSRYSVVLFQSTSGAMRAESLALQARLEVKLIPVPRQFSSDCGVCLRCNGADVHTVRAILESHLVDYDAFHPLSG